MRLRVRFSRQTGISRVIAALAEQYLFLEGAKSWDPCHGAELIDRKLAPLVRLGLAAYHCGQGGKGAGRRAERRPQLARAGTTMPVDESPLTRASLLVQI